MLASSFFHFFDFGPVSPFIILTTFTMSFLFEAGNISLLFLKDLENIDVIHVEGAIGDFDELLNENAKAIFIKPNEKIDNKKKFKKLEDTNVYYVFW